MGEETFFSLFSLFFIVFSFTFGFIILFIIIKIIKATKENKSFPKLSVPAKIISKRKYYSKNHHPNCYVTFEFESKDKLELFVPSSHYNFLYEGDEGILTFKHREFINFE